MNQSRFVNSAANLDELQELDALTALAESGKLRMPRVTLYGLSDVASAFVQSATGQTVGKVGILVSNSTAVT